MVGYLRLIPGLLAIVLLSPIICVEFASSQELGKSFGVIDQVTTAGFLPVSLFILEESPGGSIRQFRADFVPYESDKQDSATSLRLLVGAVVPIPQGSSANSVIRHTFFLASKDSSFAATEVKKWTIGELIQNSVSEKVLQEQTRNEQQTARGLRNESLLLTQKLAKLREDAVGIVDLDEIVSARIQKRALEQEIQKNSHEVERLDHLVEYGRELEDPDWIDDYRQQLTIHLQEAAKVTAVADRLDQRRREAAVQRFLQKVSLVEGMGNADPRALAQEVLQLRRKRRELENRLGITSADAPSDQF